MAAVRVLLRGAEDVDHAQRLLRAARIVVEMGLLGGRRTRRRVRTGLRCTRRDRARSELRARARHRPCPSTRASISSPCATGWPTTRPASRRTGRRAAPRARVLLSTVAISTGFLAPLHLLAGLVAEVEDDWELILTQYGRAVSRRHDPLSFRTLQAFEFDCWLLWGPSIPVCTCRQWSGVKAVQYGYGDETTPSRCSYRQRRDLRRLLADLSLVSSPSRCPSRGARDSRPP